MSDSNVDSELDNSAAVTENEDISLAFGDDNDLDLASEGGEGAQTEDATDDPVSSRMLTYDRAFTHY
jgi:hypothetical protein